MRGTGVRLKHTGPRRPRSAGRHDHAGGGRGRLFIASAQLGRSCDGESAGRESRAKARARRSSPPQSRQADTARGSISSRSQFPLKRWRGDQGGKLSVLRMSKLFETAQIESPSSSVILKLRPRFQQERRG